MMLQMLAVAGAAAMISVSVSACAASDQDSEAPPAVAVIKAEKSEAKMSDLRLPVNQRFANLKSYLLYLQNHSGPSDGPWYKQIRPGVYELQTGNKRTIVGMEKSEQKRIFTRQELLEKFGFTQ